MSAVETGRDWRAGAVCREVDPDLFFPTAERGAVYAAQVADAKRVCAVCPVWAACLEHALAWVPEGVAGGLSKEERQALRARRRHVLSPEAARLEAGLRLGATRSEVAEAGRVLLAAGRSRREIAARCAVSVRTVERWASTPPGPGTRSGAGVVGEGSHGGHRAPLRISRAHNEALAGTNEHRKGHERR